jgi:hypothetical protein
MRPPRFLSPAAAPSGHVASVWLGYAPRTHTHPEHEERERERERERGGVRV